LKGFGLARAASRGQGAAFAFPWAGLDESLEGSVGLEPGIVSHDVSQVCLAGPRLCNDWSLIQALKPRHVVTLVDQVRFLAAGSFLTTVRVLVLDGVESSGEALGLLPALLGRCPLLCVVLVDGGLDQRQLATAFQLGVRDYFPEPVDVRLLAERVGFLSAGPPPRGHSPPGAGAHEDFGDEAGT
jgi:hypothetical protein